MKRKKSLSIFTLFISLVLISFSSSCQERNETISCFPYSDISVSLNLNFPYYNKLQNIGEWIYVNDEGSGNRGLIVVRTANGFMVYDRNAPHICPDNETTLQVKDGIKIVCPKDDSEWILITGQPTRVSKIPPKTYGYSFDPYSNILSIYN